MFNRLSRVFRSFIGFFISVAENPELILEQNIRDMNDQVPRMNESIAMVKANVTLLEKENQKYKNDVIEQTSKVKAAIQAGRDDIATTYATQLQVVKSALTPATWNDSIASATLLCHLARRASRSACIASAVLRSFSFMKACLTCIALS